LVIWYKFIRPDAGDDEPPVMVISLPPAIAPMSGLPGVPVPSSKRMSLPSLMRMSEFVSLYPAASITPDDPMDKVPLIAPLVAVILPVMVALEAVRFPLVDRDVFCAAHEKLVPSHRTYLEDDPALKCPDVFAKTPVPLVRVCEEADDPKTITELSNRNVFPEVTNCPDPPSVNVAATVALVANIPSTSILAAATVPVDIFPPSMIVKASTQFEPFHELGLSPSLVSIHRSPTINEPPPGLSVGGVAERMITFPPA
jgi:hypothetical protein